MIVLSKKQIFAQYKKHELDHGLTITDILNELGYPQGVWQYTEVRINGYKIFPKNWGKCRPNEDTITSVAIVPAGGDSNSFASTIATVALIYSGAAGAGALGLTGGKAAIFTAGVTLVGSQIINNMFPPPEPELTKFPKRTSRPVITGQSNQPDQYGPVIRNYGTNRVYPRVAAEPFVYYVGRDQYLVGLYDFGIGEQNIDPATIKLGETPLLEYEDVEYNVASNKDDLVIYTQNVTTEDFNVEFENLGDSAIRTSPENTESIELGFNYYGGLFGTRTSRQYVEYVQNEMIVQIRETGTTFWRDYDDYDYEIDTEYRVENQEYFYLALKPDTYQKYIEYEPSYYNGPATSPVWYATVGFYSDIITYRIPEEEEQPGKTSRVLAVGDSFWIDYPRYRRKYKVVEVFPNFNDLGPGYYRCRVDTRLELTSRFSHSEDVETPLNERVWLDDPNNASYRVQCFSSSSKINIRRKTGTPFNFTLKINPKEGKKQWDIRVVFVNQNQYNRSVAEDIYYSNNAEASLIDDYYEKTYFNKFRWEYIRSHQSVSPINTKVEHTFLELKIRATDQLNGRIENLSAVCNSVLDVYDPVNEIWKREESSNPAWVFADILTGTINQRAVSKDRLDVDSLASWAEYCNTNTVTYQSNTIGFECNFVLDYVATIKQILDQVTSTARATISINGGKYGVLIDEEKTTPTQMFNQRNVLSFSSQRGYLKIPDAIKCVYIDPQSLWQKNEIIAYNDGYDASNAELIEEIECFGTTSLAQAWRQGRYFLAQQKLRQDEVTIKVDFENLVCSRGDLVLFSHDVMKNGGEPARVTAISGNNVTLDIPVASLGGSEILRVRKRLTDVVEDSNVISFVNTNTLELDNVSNIQIDDLCVFGVVNSINQEYIVKSISFEDDFAATLVLFEYNSGVYDADTGAIPEYTITSVSSPLDGNSYPGIVNNLQYAYNIDCHQSEKRYVYNVDLTWDAPTSGSTVDLYEVYVKIEGQQQLAGFSRNNQFNFEISGLLLNKEHEFKVVALDGFGNKMPLGNAASVTLFPEDDQVAPAEVEDLNANVLTETITLDWKLNDDCDIDRYYIRFSPKTQNAAWGQSISVTSTGSTQNTVQVPLRTGTYFIKAIDWAGNYSETANFVVTQVPELQNVEFISEINAPTWEGTFNDTQNFGDSLTLRSIDNLDTFVEVDGDFVFQEVFDLGDIYTARFESNVLASGFTKNSLMVNWPTLADIDQIAGGFNDDDWDVSTYIRSRDNVNYMSAWAKLSDVDYMSFGSEATAKPWQKFTNADFTGRIFQLKVELEGDQTQTISPIVDNVNIIANWTERIEEDRDILSGTAVTFNYPFIEIPSIQITSQENISQGDYYQITSKSEAGFTVQFYDKDNNAVNDRKYDWIAKGYGKKYNLTDINF